MILCPQSTFLSLKCMISLIFSLSTIIIWDMYILITSLHVCWFKNSDLQRHISCLLLHFYTLAFTGFFFRCCCRVRPTVTRAQLNFYRDILNFAWFEIISSYESTQPPLTFSALFSCNQHKWWHRRVCRTAEESTSRGGIILLRGDVNAVPPCSDFYMWHINGVFHYASRIMLDLCW